MYSCFWHSRYNVSLDSKSKCLHCLGKKSLFLFVVIITLRHHSPYHFYPIYLYHIQFFPLNLTSVFHLASKGNWSLPPTSLIASSKPFLNVSHSFGGGSTRTICSFQDTGAPKWHSDGFSFILHFSPNSWYSVWVFLCADIFSLVT